MILHSKEGNGLPALNEIHVEKVPLNGAVRFRGVKALTARSPDMTNPSTGTACSLELSLL